MKILRWSLKKQSKLLAYSQVTHTLKSLVFSSALKIILKEFQDVERTILLSWAEPNLCNEEILLKKDSFLKQLLVEPIWFK